MLRRTGSLAFLTVALALAIVATAALGAGSKPKPNPSVTIGTAKIGKLGTVLVNRRGYVLYMYQPDQHSKVACNHACQTYWPPVVAPATGVAKAVGRAKQSLIGSLKNPYDGKRIVTYNGWPLYTFVSDGRPRSANGQNINVNGGYWWVLTPAGHPEK